MCRILFLHYSSGCCRCLHTFVSCSFGAIPGGNIRITGTFFLWNLLIFFPSARSRLTAEFFSKTFLPCIGLGRASDRRERSFSAGGLFLSAGRSQQRPPPVHHQRPPLGHHQRPPQDDSSKRFVCVFFPFAFLPRMECGCLILKIFSLKFELACRCRYTPPATAPKKYEFLPLLAERSKNGRNVTRCSCAPTTALIQYSADKKNSTIFHGDTN